MHQAVDAMSCLPDGLELCGGGAERRARWADTGVNEATLEQLGADTLLLSSRGLCCRFVTHPHQYICHAPMELLPKWEEPGLTFLDISRPTSRHKVPLQVDGGSLCRNGSQH